jgi:hypothetical protein
MGFMFRKMVVAALVLAVAGVAFADTAVWEVATVNGTRQFDISPDGSTLNYHKQPKSDYNWYNASGDIIYSGGEERTGSKTFAETNVAVGQKISDLELSFYCNPNYVILNFYLTDGAGNHGIFSLSSSGLLSHAMNRTEGGDWDLIGIDFQDSDITDGDAVKVYEGNGISGTTWGDIKDYTISGHYDTQYAPEGGWAPWTDGPMWDAINTVGVPGVTNGYGVSLAWGDTVGNDAYVNNTRSIRDLTLGFGNSSFDAVFHDATAEGEVPEPSTMLLLGLGAAGLFVVGRRRRS